MITTLSMCRTLHSSLNYTPLFCVKVVTFLTFMNAEMILCNFHLQIVGTFFAVNTIHDLCNCKVVCRRELKQFASLPHCNNSIRLDDFV